MPETFETHEEKLHLQILQSKVGVFVDLANISYGGTRIRFDVLRKYAEMRGQVLRLNTYLSYDVERAETDWEYEAKANNFFALLRDLGYHLTVKEVRWYADHENPGRRIGKANADMDMAVDMILQSQPLDLVIMLTGDGDFIKAVQALRNQGKRVELIGFDNVSRALREQVDSFTSGYILPNLLASSNKSADGEYYEWGEVGSTVRGVCYFYKPDEGFGYLSFLKRLSTDLWMTDPRNPNSPFGAAFFHDSALPSEVNVRELPSRKLIFEYELGQSSRGLVATNIRLVTHL